MSIQGPPRRVINRREFLRLAGLTGVAALGTQATFVSSQASAAGAEETPHHAWWVKTVETPTTEIDWDRIQRFDARRTVQGSFIEYVGPEEALRLSALEAENEKQRILDNVPGYTLKDQAMGEAQRGIFREQLFFLGPQVARTPESRGVPRWTGSPEEGAQILRAAMRHFGAALVGFAKLDEQTRKLIYAFDPDGKALEFEEVEEGYETNQKRVIPNKAQWVIVYAIQMSGDTFKRVPTAIAEQTTQLAYTRGALVQNLTQEFLRGLGYQGLGRSSSNGLGIAPAFGVLAGLGELSRLNRMITPEFGPLVRLFLMVTDLPLAVDKPIDAGIAEFCKYCKKCAEACPADALSYEDEPTWQTKGQWNNPGHKAYFEDSIKCYTYWKQEAGTNCGICFAVCPFSKKDKAWIHAWAKATIATAPALDSFVRSMDDAFSYSAQKDLEAWWEMDLPEYGIDTERSVKSD